MKYLKALLVRQAARAGPTKPTEAPIEGPERPESEPTKPTEETRESDRPPFVGSVGSPSASTAPETPAGHHQDSEAPTGPPCAPPYPWRVPLARWPESWREAWGRRSNDLEADGLAWWQAEIRAQAEIERAKSSGRLATGSTVGEILAILDAESSNGHQ